MEGDVIFLSERKDVRKTIRFDKETYDGVNNFASKLGISFSKALKLLLYFLINYGADKSLQASIPQDDEELLNEIHTLYVRSSTNLNQATHALNSIKDLSFLDSNPEILNRKLDYISSQLDEVNSNFDNYQATFDKFISHLKRRRLNDRR